ncbi:MAG: NUDIX hydrolase [Chloroflexi bacterium]|nr:NUDIX hydrolase [Chloroflexota bacterium]
MDDYKIIATKILFEIPSRIRIIHDTLEHNGRKFPYVYIEGPAGGAATVAVDDQNQIILTRQYRHAIRSTIYDLPAGRLNRGEDPLEGARREFEEETGLYPNTFVHLGYFSQFPSTINVGTNLYFARDLTPTKQNLDEGEELDVVRLPLADVLQMITRDELIDGSLQLGVLLALQKGFLRIS